MIQIMFGVVGFGYKNSAIKTTNFMKEGIELHSVVILLGLVGIIWNNWHMFNKWMYLLRILSADDIEKLTNYETEIDKRCKLVIEEKEKNFQYWKERYDISREQTQQLLSEANTRVHELEIAVKVLKNEWMGNI